MLILSRRPGEMIQIGTEIEISVLEVRGNQIRLGISAPPDVLVLRAELTNAMTNDTARSERHRRADVKVLTGETS